MSDKDQSLGERPNMPVGIERPLPGDRKANWGSDVIADAIRLLDIPYIALNPGASYRGLHDSLVNYLGNEKPQMLLCLHEENAIAIAHGWAKVTDRAMMAIVHSNVGLMHATMAMYNAYLDRVPMLIFGATGPVDSVKRRPWVDWVHTSKDQGALVRDYVKWDDQPASLGAAIEGIMRAKQITETVPCAPTYVCFDAELQERMIETAPPMPDVTRFAPAKSWPAPDLIAAAAKALHSADHPIIMMGRLSRSEAGWATRIKLAEALGAVVLADRRQAATFPSKHPLNGSFPSAAAAQPIATTLRLADVVISLDWVDLAASLKAAWGGETVPATIIHASLDQTLANGWNNDLFGLPPIDHHILADANLVAEELLAAVLKLGPRAKAPWQDRVVPQPVAAIPQPDPDDTISVPFLAATLRKVFAGRVATLIRGPISWAEHLWEVDHPLGYLGNDGGGGLGSAPGMGVGSAMALRDMKSGRFPLSVYGDGEFMMGSSALWTAVHYQVPLMTVISNNRSYYNDELHQERMAKLRDRPVENKWIGQHIGDPDLDLAMVARAQGAEGIGPVTKAGDLEAALRQAIALVDAGKVALVDVRVDPGYDAGTRKTILGERST
jgi:thiamine pyrophosphate-dependent acetolactate synthase large subunit-like protein